jgi:hypothetical protein
MGYGATAISQTLPELLGLIPREGSILEFGQQNLEPGLSRDDVLRGTRTIFPSNEVAAQSAADRYDGINRLPVGELFRGSTYRYRCVDLYPGDFTIVVDLNRYSVSEEWRSQFDLITNFGTTEHITDQVNAFRVMHDFASAGCRFAHAVPFTGYLNHGLYNYHPLFFVFLAVANHYTIEHLGITGPWLPYTLPRFEGTQIGEGWDNYVFQSAEVTCLLRKEHDEPFELFTDFDQAVMGKLELPEPWATMLRQRHDLRIRSAGE